MVFLSTLLVMQFQFNLYDYFVIDTLTAYFCIEFSVDYIVQILLRNCVRQNIYYRYLKLYRIWNCQYNAEIPI